MAHLDQQGRPDPRPAGDEAETLRVSRSVPARHPGLEVLRPGRRRPAHRSAAVHADAGRPAQAHGLCGGLAGEAPHLRFILTHMIEEYAHHNGHADLIRESVDGQRGD
jgi:hypothetical protein